MSLGGILVTKLLLFVFACLLPNDVYQFSSKIVKQHDQNGSSSLSDVNLEMWQRQIGKRLKADDDESNDP